MGISSELKDIRQEISELRHAVIHKEYTKAPKALLDENRELRIALAESRKKVTELEQFIKNLTVPVLPGKPL